jgi:hypothetical protein
MPGTIRKRHRLAALAMPELILRQQFTGSLPDLETSGSGSLSGGNITNKVSCIPPLARFLRDLQVSPVLIIVPFAVKLFFSLAALASLAVRLYLFLRVPRVLGGEALRPHHPSLN